VFTDDNVFRGEAKPPAPSGATKPIAAPAVRTLAVDVMERDVRERAGCQPRDAIDHAYVTLADGWRVGKGRPLVPGSAPETDGSLRPAGAAPTPANGASPAPNAASPPPKPTS
jgi:hypothetical protein